MFLGQQMRKKNYFHWFVFSLLNILKLDFIKIKSKEKKIPLGLLVGDQEIKKNDLQLCVDIGTLEDWFKAVNVFHQKMVKQILKINNLELENLSFEQIALSTKYFQMEMLLVRIRKSLIDFKALQDQFKHQPGFMNGLEFISASHCSAQCYNTILEIILDFDENNDETFQKSFMEGYLEALEVEAFEQEKAVKKLHGFFQKADPLQKLIKFNQKIRVPKHVACKPLDSSVINWSFEIRKALQLAEKIEHKAHFELIIVAIDTFESIFEVAHPENMRLFNHSLRDYIRAIQNLAQELSRSPLNQERVFHALFLSFAALESMRFSKKNTKSQMSKISQKVTLANRRLKFCCKKSQIGQAYLMAQEEKLKQEIKHFLQK